MNQESQALRSNVRTVDAIHGTLGISAGIVASVAALSLGCAPVAGLLLIALGVGQIVAQPAASLSNERA